MWLAALVPRLSGLALAAFLPLHFLVLALAISGETAATAATSCPANRTIRESAVHTAFTPASASAFEVSIETISPAGISAPIIRP